MTISRSRAFKFIDCWIGKRLQLLRTDHGYPVGFIADLIDLSENDYGKIEAGDARISMTNLNTLSRFYNVKITDFFDEAKAFLQNLNLKQNESGPTPEEGLKLLHYFFSIRSPEQRQALLKEAEFFANPDEEPQGQC